MIRPSRPQTTAAVAAHYDELDPFYRALWGEHVHHGYWATGRETPDKAAEALVELVADRLAIAPGQALCDIGCGYGATARMLAERHGVDVTGVTVSQAQAAQATDRAPLRGAVTIRKQDWLANGLASGSFDRAYAIESSEHMEDKARFFSEAFRVVRPGGRLVVCAWLARPAPRPWEVRWLLEPICREGRLPGMGEEKDYRQLAERVGFVTTSSEDLSDRVARTWWVCACRLAGKLATERSYLRHLLDPRASDRVFALTLLRLLTAYRTGSMRYGLFVFDRPA
ncbi:MAG: cyclopropane-fatty-acyl-phospholipid synthase family protein [Geminicoccaceae bacterium]